MIALLDLVKKHELPPNVKCRQVWYFWGLLFCCLWLLPTTLPRSPPQEVFDDLLGVCCLQVFPTSGQRSTSLWDVPSVDVLQIWLDEYLDVDCTNEVYEARSSLRYCPLLGRLRTMFCFLVLAGFCVQKHGSS